MNNTLGKLLENLRKKKKLSLRKASEITGLSFTYIRNLELNINPKTGESIRPTTDTLQKFAVAYDYPLEELLKLAGYNEVAHAFQNILNDPDISDKKKDLVKMIMDLKDDDKELEKIINVLKALK